MAIARVEPLVCRGDKFACSFQDCVAANTVERVPHIDLEQCPGAVHREVLDCVSYCLGREGAGIPDTNADFVGAKTVQLFKGLGCLSKHLPTSRRMVSPTATGRTEPSFFFNGMGRAAQSTVVRGGGKSPLRQMPTSVAKEVSRWVFRLL